MPKELPSPELLRKLLRYEPDTGKLFWRERTPDMFSDGRHTANHRCANWNARYADKEAFTSFTAKGYRTGGVLGKRQQAHRVIWAIALGKWPSGQIDHINGVRTDNRIFNLRDVCPRENNKNQKVPVNNTSGAIGVVWHKGNQRWRAMIKCHGVQHHLGNFTDINDAIAARKAAEIRFNFHANHGRTS